MFLRRQSLKPTIIKQKKNVIREKKDFRSVERPFAHRHSLCNTPKHPINTEKTKSVLTTPLLKGMFVQKKCPKISQFRALKRLKIRSRLKAEIQAAQIKEKNQHHQHKWNVDQIDLKKYRSQYL